MRRLLLATRNEGKLTELRRILGDAKLDVELVGTDAFPDLPDVVESGRTFAENASLKARTAANLTGVPTVADDSGLCVDILGGMPGIFSARWAGRHGDDRANLDLLLAQLADIGEEHRCAAFVCAAAVALPGGEVHIVEGRLAGQVLRAPRGEGGFGYDPIFLAEGHTRTTAEMTGEQKDAISHRGKAFRAIAARLPAYLSS